MALGHGEKDYFKSLEKVVLGVKGENVRADLPEKCKNVDEQISCLLDLATDKNVLGRCYIGWSSWC